MHEENEQRKKHLLCDICQDKAENIVLLPCGHMVSLEQCIFALRKCNFSWKQMQGPVGKPLKYSFQKEKQE